ncbi:keratin, type I microfibrillar 48 kDa, component 8C-1 [Drosophila sulfurigaster albostrigata]|uniref:keratin, type I microfibrillar 48 kDa, component 8C-1 n=1 Tax=Drosophila sulfurigaster albostrigata TaxID=89887 RepID=UPI002D21C556|nr:keratin, type I microfibrillar 48 kDa, component 8C-1 [Drosophila sulfurigaster albostrigata]
MADLEDEAVATDAEENEEAQEAKEEDEAPEDLEVEEEALEEAEVDPFELLNEDTEDNEEQERMYREYLDLTKQIDCQKNIINNMLARKMNLIDQQCKTRKDKADLKKLRICIDQENIKLHTMTNRAIQLQNFGSARLYGDIELPIDEFEQNIFMPTPPSCCSSYPSTSKRRGTKLTAQQICDACEACGTSKGCSPCNPCKPCDPCSPCNPCNTCGECNPCNNSSTDSDDAFCT